MFVCVYVFVFVVITQLGRIYVPKVIFFCLNRNFLHEKIIYLVFSYPSYPDKA